jgi:hypothetical protein
MREFLGDATTPVQRIVVGAPAGPEKTKGAVDTAPFAFGCFNQGGLCSAPEGQLPAPTHGGVSGGLR